MKHLLNYLIPRSLIPCFKKCGWSQHLLLISRHPSPLHLNAVQVTRRFIFVILLATPSRGCALSPHRTSRCRCLVGRPFGFDAFAIHPFGRPGRGIVRSTGERADRLFRRRRVPWSACFLQSGWRQSWSWRFGGCCSSEPTAAVPQFPPPPPQLSMPPAMLGIRAPERWSSCLSALQDGYLMEMPRRPPRLVVPQPLWSFPTDNLAPLLDLLRREFLERVCFGGPVAG